jgi:hypothetical protein
VENDAEEAVHVVDFEEETLEKEDMVENVLQSRGLC